MGSSQSITSRNVATDQQLVPGYALRIKHDLEYDDMVMVDDLPNEPRVSQRSVFEGQALKVDAAKQWERKLLAKPKNQLALSALLINPIKNVVNQKVVTMKDQQVFSHVIPFEGAPIPNQNNSGRCWLFATTNVFRVAFMKKYNLKSFELSQQYPFFWDKLERSNWALTQFIETANQDLDSREVQELLKQPITDGGQWDMASNLIQKYGLVPQVLYPDSYSAAEPKVMDKLLTSKLREDCLKLRELKNSEKCTAGVLQDTKAQMLKEIHTIITLMLGPPPQPDEKFTWEYYDANNKFQCVKLTPLEFVQGLSASPTIRRVVPDFTKWFSLVNDPRHDYLTHLTVSRLGNVVEGNPIRYVNVDTTTMKNAAISMIRQGQPVWFGCDVGQSSGGGILDTHIYDYGLALNTSFPMTKAQRLQTKDSSMTHAMVLTGVHIVDDKPVRWRVMNSYGPDVGTDGYYLMTDDWMTEYCYQVVTDANHVSKEVVDVLTQKPTVLPLWDPMGTLA